MTRSAPLHALRVRLRARILALKRRAAMVGGGEFNPYPPVPAGVVLSPSAALAPEFDAAPLVLGWKRAGAGNVDAWQGTARAKLAQLLATNIDRVVPRILSDEEMVPPPNLRRRRLYCSVGVNRDVPINLFWRPGSGPYKVMLCLTGTTVGAHCAWGEALNPGDPPKIANGLDLALQAARRGYLAVVVEQLGFGERREQGFRPTSPVAGTDAAHHALLVGRTLLGLWVSDVMSVVDWLQDQVDIVSSEHIYAMGHSAGGTTALFTAAIDTRIAGVVASGCVGSWLRNQVRRRDQEGQLAIPGILNWLELSDVLGLVAPRLLLVLSGNRDHIWPFEEALQVVEEAAQVYEAAGALQNIRAVRGEGGHRFYPKVSWSAFDALLTSVGN